MATWGDQTFKRFEATAVGFETGFSHVKKHVRKAEKDDK